MRVQFAKSNVLPIVLTAIAFVTGCSSGQNEIVDFKQILADIAPKLAEAESVTIYCRAPESTAAPDPFTILVGKRLATKIEKEGFPPAIAKLSESAKRPRVFVVDQANTDTTNSDGTIHIDVTEHILDGQFSKKGASISRKFTAEAWLKSSASESPFHMTAGFSSSAKATPPEDKEVEEMPSWTDHDYSEDEKTRDQEFATECADNIYQTMNSLTEQLSGF